ncbi:ABC transporter substrate-binding protein [Pseudonocardia zijingensis]|uniref:ABC transporter substrate-binding protein n=1 Tax=Pseudonocardia zijingensis TaxID=153376 RepID=UPI0031CE7E91
MSAGHARVATALLAATAVALTGCASSVAAGNAPGISGDVVRIGFITDMSGPYVGIDGPAGAEMVRKAVAEKGGAVGGAPVEVIVADHRNKADVAAAEATEFFDRQGVDVLIGGVNSGSSLAMAAVARERRKPFVAVGAGDSSHTGEQCSPYTVHYAYSTTAWGRIAGRAGGDDASWYFLTADYAFGRQMHDAAARYVTSAGRTVAGAAHHPRGAPDLTPLVQQAHASGAEVIGLASGHDDLARALTAVNTLGLRDSVAVVGMHLFITELDEIGLEHAQGMYVPAGWFWTRDAETRAWSERFFAEFGRMPTSLQAADYSAALQYLNAVEGAGSDDADAVLARLRNTRINDVYTKNGYIRGDGHMVHDMYLLQVKEPGESAEPWDYYRLVETVEGEAAWPTKGESACPLWK